MNNTITLSEYKRQFVGDKDGTFRENYLNMVQMRNQRKSHEKSHTPIIWLDDDNDHDDREDKKKRNNRKLCLNKNMEVDTTTKCCIDDENIQPQSPPVSTMKTSKSVLNGSEESFDKENITRSLSVQTCIETKTRDVGVQSPRHQRAWNKQSIVTRKPLKAKKSVIQEKPFISYYGWADKTSIQKKKTYNVKAPLSDVRLTALRAAKRREERISHMVTQKERLNQEKVQTQAVIDSLTNFDHWQTEYQIEFCKKLKKSP